MFAELRDYKLKLNKKETNTLIALIDSEQFDGAKWAINDIWLDDLKKKLSQEIK